MPEFALRTKLEPPLGNHRLQTLVQGHNLRLLDELQEVGRHQHLGPENQDSQHMLDQPRVDQPERLGEGSKIGRSPKVVRRGCCEGNGG